MLFKFLQRSAPAARKPAAKPAPGGPVAARRSSAQPHPGLPDRLPVPEMQERDDDSAWDEWEHSQMELDSRMGSPSAFDSIKVKDATPSQLDDLDPFSTVRKRG